MSDSENDTKGLYGSDGMSDVEVSGGRGGRRRGSNVDSDAGSSERSPSPPPAPKVKDVQINRFPPSHASQQTLFGRIPAFLDLEAKPFDSENVSQFTVPSNPNTIRWKYGRNEKGDMDKLSNARIVEWEDGSRTLQVGEEQFEMRAQAPAEPIFLVVQNQETLETASIVDDQITLIPTSMASATHVRLARQLAARAQTKQVHVGSHATTDDPEQMQRNTQIAESAKDKARRKLEQKREEEQPQRSSYASRHHRASSDDDEDEDEEEEEEEEPSDIEEESDEDEERARRLQSIKRKNDNDQEGSSRRRKMIDDDSD